MSIGRALPATILKLSITKKETRQIATKSWVPGIPLQANSLIDCVNVPIRKATILHRHRLSIPDPSSTPSAEVAFPVSFRFPSLFSDTSFRQNLSYQTYLATCLGPQPSVRSHIYFTITNIVSVAHNTSEVRRVIRFRNDFPWMAPAG